MAMKIYGYEDLWLWRFMAMKTYGYEDPMDMKI